MIINYKIRHPHVKAIKFDRTNYEDIKKMVGKCGKVGDLLVERGIKGVAKFGIWMRCNNTVTVYEGMYVVKNGLTIEVMNDTLFNRLYEECEQ